jgi:hypothetical protein
MDERDTPAVGGTAPYRRPGRHLPPKRWSWRPVANARGRYAAPSRWPLRGVAAAATVLAVVLCTVLAVRVIGTAEQRSGSALTGTTFDALGPPPQSPPRPSAFGNLVTNWSFEQDLSGWAVIGPGTASREFNGRTSGSSATVRPNGLQPERVGLVLLKAVPSVQPGSRYVASAWVRSTSADLKVNLQLTTDGRGSQASVTTLPGDWRRVTVSHTVAVTAALDLVIAATVPSGQAVVVDEVQLRKA